MIFHYNMNIDIIQWGDRLAALGTPDVYKRQLGDSYLCMGVRDRDNPEDPSAAIFQAYREMIQESDSDEDVYKRQAGRAGTPRYGRMAKSTPGMCTPRRGRSVRPSCLGLSLIHICAKRGIPDVGRHPKYQIKADQANLPAGDATHLRAEIPVTG